MKILLVNDYATPTGGAEFQTLALRDGLRQRGHDARLFASRARYVAGEIQADYHCFGTTSSFQVLLMTANPSALWEFRRVLTEFRPDVVHVNMFLWQLSPLILPVLREVPSLYHVRMYKPICPLGTKMLPDGRACEMRAGAACYRNNCLTLRAWLPLMLQMRLWRRWRHAFNLIVANSEAVRGRLMAEGIQPVEVVWDGVPILPPRPALSSPPTVAFAGRLVREKGVDLLVRAFARVVAHIPEARLLIAGAGSERGALERLILALGLSSRVSLLGHLSRPELERRLAAAWIQAVPSRWAEPFGLVATEAMMRGTAVVASASGGLTEIVRHGQTGFLVPPNDIDSLTEAMLTLLRDHVLAEEMGKAGRGTALADFTDTACLNKILPLYERLCDAH